MNNYEIVFLNTPIYSNSVDDGEDYLPPLGQGYIVTQLMNHDINAKLIDCVYERMGVEEVVALINNSNVPNIALNVFSVNYEIVKKIVEKTTRKVTWFLGGKAIKHLWMNMRCWDWKENNVVYTIGECDNLYTDLLLGKCKELPIYENGNQKAYEVNKNSMYYPQNLDRYPLKRELFKGRAIRNHYGNLEQSLIGSRECIYNCAFCGGSRYANGDSTVRTRSSNNIVKEIEEILHIEPQINSIRILDDLFLKDRRNVLQAIDIFNGFSGIQWRGMAHINSLLKSHDLFEQLKESGCDELFIGIESGSPVIREQIHKTGTVEDTVSVIKALLAVGIDVKGYFVCGFPNENADQLFETVRLAKRIKKLASNYAGDFRATAFQFRPYHGTEIYDKLQRSGEINENYHVEKNTAGKMQYSFITINYSDVEDTVLKDCIDEIMNGAIYGI